MKQIFKTTLLMAILTGLFMMVGYVFGGQQGMLIALGLAAVSNFFMYFFSSSLVIKMQGAQPLGNHYPQVERIVRELAAQAARRAHRRARRHELRLLQIGRAHV